MLNQSLALFWRVKENGRLWSVVDRAYVDFGNEQEISIDTELNLSITLNKLGFRGPVVTNDQVNEERDARISVGVEVDIEGVSFRVQTRNETDFRNINGLVSKALVLLLSGDTTTTVSFRDADDVSHTLNAAGLISMGNQVASFAAGIYSKSWALKAMSPIPIDYDDDEWWQ